MKQYGLLSLLLVSMHSLASTPLFSVTPNVIGQAQLNTGENGTYIYQITNNTRNTLSNLGMARLPFGVTTVDNAGLQYCSFPLSLASGSSCLVKLNVNSYLAPAQISGGPQVCLTPNNPVYCSQPFTNNQLATTVLSAPSPTTCAGNESNFNYELTQNFDASSFTPGWGPTRNDLMLSPSYPDLTNCVASAGVTWARQRIVAAAAFWVAQKLNYCHHYNPDYATPLSGRGAALTEGGYCNPAVDLAPGSVYYGQVARWNYNGKGSETANNWVNNNQMWYGMDCSNTSAFVYNFAFGPNSSLGIPFDSKTSSQAGQITGVSLDTLSPNTQDPLVASKILNNPNEAGLLMCADGTLDPDPNNPSMCTGHQGYLSGIDSSGTFTKSVTVDQLVPVLQPGDLLFIAGAGPQNQPNPDGSTSDVTHVIMWLGKQVGYGANDINPALIAPDDVPPCDDPNVWQPKIGDWVIVDSHYQGYDYRVLTRCFYLNNLWGVRRVIL